MPYTVRPMRLEDVPQVTEIDREAFPTMPPPSFAHELNSRTSRYLVVCEDAPEGHSLEFPGTDHQNKGGGFLSGLKELFGRKPSPTTNQKTLGFAGFWFTVDEAHLLTIAVREAHRGRGIGELLLISALDLASKIKAQFMTLEVRVSNHQAQALYQKYGFIEVGVRRHYYTDNQEDALIMSTENLHSPLFQSNFQRLKRAYNQRVQG